MPTTFFWTYAKSDSTLETLESQPDEVIMKLSKGPTLAALKVSLNGTAAFTDNSLVSASTLKNQLTNLLALGKSLAEEGKRVFASISLILGNDE